MKRDSHYDTRPGGGSVVATDTTLAPAGMVGRVWALGLNATTAVACVWTIRTGSLTGTILWVIYAPAIADTPNFVEFPNGLYFNDGLFVDEVLGVGTLSICWNTDEGG
jgi:hypothetical protein